MSIKLFDQSLFTPLAKAAQANPRLRSNHNVHSDLTDPAQRLFISLEPGSYVRPHRHSQPEKWEFFFIVSGEVSFLIFDQQGALQQRYLLSSDGDLKGLEIPHNTWHTVMAVDKPAAFFEVKQGPYLPMEDKDFATWAPVEGDPHVNLFLTKLKALQIGERVSDE